MATIRTADDEAMRADFNAILRLYNEAVTHHLIQAPDNPAREDIVRKIQDLWDTYLASDIFGSDKDVIQAMASLRADYLPTEIAAACLVKAAASQTTDKVTLLNDRRKPESCFLMHHQDDSTSQGGEDGIITKILDLIGVKNRWCCEFGAFDGVYCSNTHQLVADSDWQGVLIEGDASRFQELEKTYQGNNRAHLFQQLVGFDNQRDSIDVILSRTAAPIDLDLMIIDIDGNDWHVWETMETYRPRVLVIEFNPTIANDVFYVQARDPSLQRGCSLNALVALGKQKGYELICATSWNAFFVTTADFGKVGIADNSIDALYTPFMDGRIFQGMDSTVQTIGMPGFLWDARGFGKDWTKVIPERLIVNP